MACGCKKGARGGGSVFRPTTTARSTSGGIAAGLTPTQLKAQQAPISDSSGLTAERRKVMAARRAAINKALNK